MSASSKIEWTEATWNPIRARNRATGGVGHFCVHVSPGCKHCYAERMQPRFGNPVRYAAQDREKVELFLDEHEVTVPLRFHKPRTVFVCSMTDLFLEDVPDAWINRIFAVMALCPGHVFQVLTKRPERMRKYLVSSNVSDERRDDIALEALALVHEQLPNGDLRGTDEEAFIQSERWPLPNVWLGVSCENQVTANKRIPLLLETPAALRFVSAEPLLEPVDFRHLLERGDADLRRTDPLAAVMLAQDEESGHAWVRPALDWIIVGGESGPGARPFDLDGARLLIRQCRAAGTPCFVKQLGTHWAGKGVMRRDRKGADPSEWPEDLRVREMPT